MELNAIPKNPIGYYFGITIIRLALLNTFNGLTQRLNYQPPTIKQLLWNDASFILWENRIDLEFDFHEEERKCVSTFFFNRIQRQTSEVKSVSNLDVSSV